MGKHSKNKKLHKALSDEGPKLSGQNSGNKTNSAENLLQSNEQEEKSAFEVLKLNRKVDKSSTSSTPTKSKRPLASEMRKRRRASDGIGVRHVPIRTNAEIFEERRTEADEISKGDHSNTTSSTEQIAILPKKLENETAKKTKRKVNKRNDRSGPVRKHPRSVNDEHDNIFAELITADEGNTVSKKEDRVVHKKKVVGGKLVEYDERESSIVDEEDALIIDNLGSDVIESIDEGEDESEHNGSESDMGSDEVEENESYKKAMMKEKLLMKKERKDFKPEDYCVIIKEKATKGDRSTIDFNELPFSKIADSVQNAKDAFQWIISPMKLDEFFEGIFEKKALVVQRNNRKYYGNLFSTKKFVEILQSHYIEYGANVNVAVYKDGERFTPNGIGKVYPEEIQAQLNAGHSVQFVNPQTFCDSVWHLCDTTQELFGSFVGANTYLTPAGTAGFAPHWDEIDAFLLQLEGRKHWKVFAPIDDDDSLPRDSSDMLMTDTATIEGLTRQKYQEKYSRRRSRHYHGGSKRTVKGNFSDSDMIGRTPIFDGWIEHGDLLYIPRGFIHQGYTEASTHSLHLTISVCRRTAFVDLLERFIPLVVSSLAEKNLSMRSSLPIEYLDMGGVLPLNYQRNNKASDKIFNVLDKQLNTLKKDALDAYESAIDMMAREYLKTALPPLLTEEERQLSAIGGMGFDILSKEQKEFTMNTQIKFIRRHAQRLIFETEDRCFIVHRMANSRIYEGRPEVIFDLDVELSDGFASLLEAYPEWCAVSKLKCNNDHDRIKLAKILYGNGLILAKF